MILGSAGIDARARPGSSLPRRGTALAGSRPPRPEAEETGRSARESGPGVDGARGLPSVSRPVGSRGAAYVSASPGAEAAGSPSLAVRTSPASGRKS